MMPRVLTLVIRFFFYRRVLSDVRDISRARGWCCLWVLILIRFLREARLEPCAGVCAGSFGAP